MISLVNLVEGCDNESRQVEISENAVVGEILEQFAQGIPDCVVYATTIWQGKGTFVETFRLMGFRGNEEKFKDYLEDICELLRDQLQINILRRQHCDDMAGNGSSDSESTDSSDASDDTEDEDKGDKDASTPKRDGHGYGYPSGECSGSAAPTTGEDGHRGFEEASRKQGGGDVQSG